MISMTEAATVVFINYANADEAFALRLYDDLHKARRGGVDLTGVTLPTGNTGTRRSLVRCWGYTHGPGVVALC